MQPDPVDLIEALGLETPLVGFYDAPDPAPFAPLVAPAPGARTCMFSFYRNWLRGETLHLTREHYGCRGAGSCLLGLDTRPSEELVTFLFEDEGLKRTRELTCRYVERRHIYRPRHPHLLFGPLRPGQYEHLKTVTFWVQPDQLAALVTGAHYDCGPDDPPPVCAPFGSGCSQLLPAFEDLDAPRASIGATDAAMRPFLPADTLAFTATRPMFERLCSLGEGSFLHRPFWRNLCRARGA